MAARWAVVRRRLGPQKVSERRVCRVLDQPLAVHSVISHVGRMMNHGYFVRCVLWRGNAHALGPSVFMGYS